MNLFKRILIIFGISFVSIASIVGIAIGIMFAVGYFSDPYVELESIAFENQEYKVSDNFQITINANSPEVTELDVNLSFVSGSVTDRGDKITDGIIIIPKTAKLGVPFTVELSKRDLTTPDGEMLSWIKGGITNIKATSTNIKVLPATCEIRIDVPVYGIEIELYRASDENNENPLTEIVAGSEFKAITKFIPEESKYKFSSDKDKSIDIKNAELKTVLFQTLPEEAPYIESLGENYFLAKIERNNVTLKASVFKNSNFENDLIADTSLEGEELNSYLLSNMSDDNSITETRSDLSFKKYNVGNLQVDPNFSWIGTTPPSLKYETTANKIFTLFANYNTTEANSGSIGIEITSDEMDQNLESRIKDIGIRFEVKTAGDTWVDAASSDIMVIDSNIKAYNGKNYFLPNRVGRDINRSYWQIVSGKTNSDIRCEVVLFETDESGNAYLYDTKPLLGFSAVEVVDQAIDWKADALNEIISMTIIAAGNEQDKIYPSYDLTSLIDIPTSNLYQTARYFAYFPPESGVADEAGVRTVLGDAVAAAKYVYNFSGSEEFTLYEIELGNLKAYANASFKVMYMTIKTDYNGNPILDEYGNYIPKMVSGLTTNISFLNVNVTTTMNNLAGKVVVPDSYKVAVDSETGNEVNDRIAFVGNTSKAFTLEIDCTNETDIFLGAWGTTISLIAKEGGSDVELTDLLAYRIMKSAGGYSDGDYITQENIFTERVEGSDILRSFIRLEVDTKSPAYTTGSDNKTFDLYLRYFKTSSIVEDLPVLTSFTTTTEDGTTIGPATLKKVEIYNGQAKTVKFAMLENSELVDSNGNKGGSINNKIVVVQGFDTDGRPSVQKYVMAATGESSNAQTVIADEAITPVIVKDKYGRELDSKNVVLTSSNPSVVAVSSDGEGNKTLNFNGVSDSVYLSASISGVTSEENLYFNVSSGIITSIKKDTNVKTGVPVVEGGAGSVVDLKTIYSNKELKPDDPDYPYYNQNKITLGQTIVIEKIGAANKSVYLLPQGGVAASLEIIYADSQELNSSNITNAFVYKIKKGSLDNLSEKEYAALKSMIKVGGQTLPDYANRDGAYNLVVNSVNFQRDFGYDNFSLQLTGTAGGVVNLDVQINIKSNYEISDSVEAHSEDIGGTEGLIRYKGVYAEADITLRGSGTSTDRQGLAINKIISGEDGEKEVKYSLYTVNVNTGKPVSTGKEYIDISTTTGQDGSGYVESFKFHDVAGVERYELLVCEKSTSTAVSEIVDANIFALNVRIYFQVNPNFKVSYNNTSDNNYDENTVHKLKTATDSIFLSNIIKVTRMYPEETVSIESDFVTFSVLSSVFQMNAQNKSLQLNNGRTMDGIQTVSVSVHFAGAIKNIPIKIGPDIIPNIELINNKNLTLIDDNIINSINEIREANHESPLTKDSLIQDMRFTKIGDQDCLAVRTISYYVSPVTLVPDSKYIEMPHIYMAFTKSDLDSTTEIKDTTLEISFDNSSIIKYMPSDNAVFFSSLTGDPVTGYFIKITLNKVGSINYPLYITPSIVPPIEYQKSQIVGEGGESNSNLPGTGNDKANSNMALMLADILSLESNDVYDVYDAGQTLPLTRMASGVTEALGIFADGKTGYSYEIINGSENPLGTFAEIVNNEEIKLFSTSTARVILIKCMDLSNGFTFYYRLKILPNADLKLFYPYEAPVGTEQTEHLAFYDTEETLSGTTSIETINSKKNIVVDLDAGFTDDIPNNKVTNGAGEVYKDSNGNPIRKTRFMATSVDGMPNLNEPGSYSIEYISVAGQEITSATFGNYAKIENNKLYIFETDMELIIKVKKTYSNYNDGLLYSFSVNLKHKIGADAHSFSIQYPGNPGIREIVLDAGESTEKVQIEGKDVNYFQSENLKLWAYELGQIRQDVTDKSLKIYCPPEFGKFENKVFTANVNIARTSSFYVTLYTNEGKYGSVKITVNSNIMVVDKNSYERLSTLDGIESDSTLDLQDKIAVVQWANANKAPEIYTNLAVLPLQLITETRSNVVPENAAVNVKLTATNGTQSKTATVANLPISQYDNGTKEYFIYLHDLFNDGIDDIPFNDSTTFEYQVTDISGNQLNTYSVTVNENYKDGALSEDGSFVQNSRSLDFDIVEGSDTPRTVSVDGIKFDGKDQKISFEVKTGGTYKVTINTTSGRIDASHILDREDPIREYKNELSLGKISRVEYKNIEFKDSVTRLAPKYIVYPAASAGVIAEGENKGSAFDILPVTSDKKVELKIQCKVFYEEVVTKEVEGKIVEEVVETAVDYEFDFVINILKSISNKSEITQSKPFVASKSIVSGSETAQDAYIIDLFDFNNKGIDMIKKAGFSVEVESMEGDISAILRQGDKYGIYDKDTGKIGFKTIPISSRQEMVAKIKLSYTNGEYSFDLYSYYKFVVLPAVSYETNYSVLEKNEFDAEYLYLNDYDNQNKLFSLKNETAPFAEESLILNLNIGEVTANGEITLTFGAGETKKEVLISVTTGDAQTVKNISYTLSSLGINKTDVASLTIKASEGITLHGMNYVVTANRINAFDVNNNITTAGVNVGTGLDYIYKLNAGSSSGLFVGFQNNNVTNYIRAESGKVISYTKGDNGMQSVAEFTGELPGAGVWFETAPNYQTNNNIIFDIYIKKGESNVRVGSYSVVVSTNNVFTLKTNILDEVEGEELFYQEKILETNPKIFEGYQLLKFTYRGIGEGAIGALGTTEKDIYYVKQVDGETTQTGSAPYQVGNVIQYDSKKFEVIYVDKISSKDAAQTNQRGIQETQSEKVKVIALTIENGILASAREYINDNNIELLPRLEFKYNSVSIDYSKVISNFKYRQISTSKILVKFAIGAYPTGEIGDKTYNFTIRAISKNSAEDTYTYTNNDAVIKNYPLSFTVTKATTPQTVDYAIDLSEKFPFTDFSNYRYEVVMNPADIDGIYNSTDTQIIDRYGMMKNGTADVNEGVIASSYTKAWVDPGAVKDFSISDVQVGNSYEVQFRFGRVDGRGELGDVYVFRPELNFEVGEATYPGQVERAINVSANTDVSLIDTFKLQHKDGTPLLAEDLEKPGVSLSLQIIRDDSAYPSRSSKGLSFLDISPQYSNKVGANQKIVDYRIKVAGAPNNGAKIKLKVTYTVGNGIAVERYIIVNAVPDWQITVRNGNSTENSKENPDIIEFKDAAGANLDKKEVIFTDNSAATNRISAVHSTSPSNEVAYMLRYSFFKDIDGEQVNDPDYLNSFLQSGTGTNWEKLQTGDVTNEIRWKAPAINPSNKVSITINAPTFGYKDLQLNIFDDYDYEFIYYLKLRPTGSAPNLDRVMATNYITETSSFDVVSPYQVKAGSETGEAQIPAYTGVDRVILLSGITAVKDDSTGDDKVISEVTHIYVTGADLYINNNLVENAITLDTSDKGANAPGSTLGNTADNAPIYYPVSTVSGLTQSAMSRLTVGLLDGKYWGQTIQEMGATIRLTLTSYDDNTKVKEKCVIDVPIKLQKKYAIQDNNSIVIRDGEEFMLTDYIDAKDTVSNANLGEISMNGDYIYIPGSKPNYGDEGGFTTTKNKYLTGETINVSAYHKTQKLSYSNDTIVTEGAGQEPIIPFVKETLNNAIDFDREVTNNYKNFNFFTSFDAIYVAYPVKIKLGESTTVSTYWFSQGLDKLQVKVTDPSKTEARYYVQANGSIGDNEANAVARLEKIEPSLGTDQPNYNLTLINNRNNFTIKISYQKRSEGASATKNYLYYTVSRDLFPSDIIPLAEIIAQNAQGQTVILNELGGINDYIFGVKMYTERKAGESDVRLEPIDPTVEIDTSETRFFFEPGTFNYDKRFTIVTRKVPTNGTPEKIQLDFVKGSDSRKVEINLDVNGMQKYSLYNVMNKGEFKDDDGTADTTVADIPSISFHPTPISASDLRKIKSYKIYDDTIKLYIPKRTGTINLEYEIDKTKDGVSVLKTPVNVSINILGEYATHHYIGLSSVLTEDKFKPECTNKTSYIETGEKIIFKIKAVNTSEPLTENIVVYYGVDVNGKDNELFQYGNKAVTEGEITATCERSRDSINIDTPERFSNENSNVTQVNKYYIVEIDGNRYSRTASFRVAPLYSSINTQLAYTGQNKLVYAQAATGEDGVRKYTLPKNVWSEGFVLQSVKRISDGFEKFDLKDYSNGEPLYLSGASNLEFAIDSSAAGSGAASIDNDNGTITTDRNFNVLDQYIRVQIYVKVSGADGKWNAGRVNIGYVDLKIIDSIFIKKVDVSGGDNKFQINWTYANDALKTVYLHMTKAAQGSAISNVYVSSNADATSGTNWELIETTEGYYVPLELYTNSRAVKMFDEYDFTGTVTYTKLNAT